MGEPILISIDGMGGDAAPDMVVEGVAIAGLRRPEARFEIHGPTAQIAPLIAARKGLAERVEVVEAPDAVAMDDKPSQALRRGRQTSMWTSIDAVRQGRAGAVVSAGNTGALMAMSKFQLRSAAGVDRPAIAAIWPTLRAESIVLDAGANVGCTARQLVGFAVMGAEFARVFLGVERPTVGVLNVGVEELKGNDAVREAARELRAARDLPLEFRGFVEGDGIGAGEVDVVVTDGFTGNVALKTAEGTAKQIAHYLRAAYSSSLFARIGYLFARGALSTVRARVDPRSANGGVFLGLNGVVVKSHGGADAEGFANALDLAIELAQSDIVQRVVADIARLPAAGAAGDATAGSELKEAAPA